MTLSVLKDGSKTMSHYVVLSKKDLTRLIIFVQIPTHFTTNRIKYVLYDSISF
jgi:hypothetical protein